jgi:quercetin dioxygenase-like cupin family protein
MDRNAFEAALQRDGYEIVVRTMEPNSNKPAHVHDFDARVMVVAGEMTLARDGASRAYRPGETFDIAHGHRHAEIAGPEGVSYVAGRRIPA